MPSIRDFSGGVLNQELQNLDKGAGVLFDCKNVLSSWNGELRKRTGTGLLKALNSKSKIIPYRLSNGDDMILLLSNGRIDCYSINNDGSLDTYKIGNDSTNMFPSSGWSSDTNGDWTIGSSFAGNFYPALDTGKEITQQEAENPGFVAYITNTTDDFVFKSAEFKWISTNRTLASISWYDSDPIIQYSDDNQNWTSIETSVSEVVVSYLPNRQMGYVVSSAKYSVYNDNYLGLHPYWRIVFRDGVYVSGAINNPTYKVYMKSINCWTEVTKEDLIFDNVPYSEEDFDNIRWSQNGSSLTMVSKGKKPYQIKISSGLFVGNEFSPTGISFVNEGYPAAVTYYQNRLWLGGFETNPTTVWSSKFATQDSDFDVFTIPAGDISATDPIKVRGTEIVNPIENIWGGNNALYCLSADGISMIDAQNAIVATNQVEFKLRNREPVCPVVPTVKDDIMIYVGRDKRKILITDYDFVVQRFRANNISDRYNSFLKSGIKELHYIPRKSSLIYGLLEDGKWFSLLFDTTMQKNGLFVFDSYGFVSDIQPIKKGDDTKLLIITQMPNGTYFLEEKFAQADQEIMDFMSVTEQQNYTAEVLSSKDCYLDHSMFIEREEASSEINNLVYPVGDKLEIIADGQYLGTYTVLDKGSSMLYSWDSTLLDDDTVFYTNTDTPSTESKLYNNKYEEVDARITSVRVVDNVIVGIDVETSDHELYYCNRSNNDIYMSPSYIDLGTPVNNVIIGYSYDSYAVLKFVTPYTERKFPKEIAVNFINSGYLEVGNTFDSLKSVLNNLVESVSINNKRILMNGNYAKTLDKHSFETPYVIVRSDKGLPFIITGIDYKVDISNYQGGV